jgi:hypothetical protein
MMMLSSKLGQEGDRAELISPLTTFSSATQLAFRYIAITDSSLDQSSQPPLALALYELNELQVPIRQLFQTTDRLTVNEWHRASVCIPAGRYQLMFVGTQGQPYSVDIGLDDITSEGNCSDSQPPRSN